MRIAIPGHLKGQALLEWLVKNKAELIAKKKSLPIKSDPFCFAPEIITSAQSLEAVKKGLGEAASAEDTGVIRVKVVANTAWWCDEGMDVLTDTCWDKSIQDKGILLPHIKNHAWDDCTSHVGDVVAVYKQLKKVKDLGVQKSGSTTCLMWETDVRKDYDPKVYFFYKNGKINQHSIGLQYITLELAVNNKNSEKEFDFWNKYISKIINKDKVLAAGYFWLVSEIRLIENSCVLFGMNELTPTESVTDSKSTEQQPEDITTATQPLKKKISFSSLILKP